MFVSVGLCLCLSVCLACCFKSGATKTRIMRFNGFNLHHKLTSKILIYFDSLASKNLWAQENLHLIYIDRVIEG